MLTDKCKWAMVASSAPPAAAAGPQPASCVREPASRTGEKDVLRNIEGRQKSDLGRPAVAVGTMVSNQDPAESFEPVGNEGTPGFTQWSRRRTLLSQEIALWSKVP